ncbi:MAG: hypothetical protein ACKOK8_07435, partial [Planctomycetia bacterium]
RSGCGAFRETRSGRPGRSSRGSRVAPQPEDRCGGAIDRAILTQTRVTTRTLQWKEVFEPGNQLEFNKLFRWRLGYGPSEDEGAAYAVTYLYSPVAADITLHAEGGHGHHAVRGWLNGQPLPLDPKT